MGALAAATEQKPAVVKKVLDSLTAVATKEVKQNGKFTIPGLCMIKTRVKPATKAGKREMFGKDWPGRGHCLVHGAEEVGLRQGAGQLGRGRDEGGDEDWQARDVRPGRDGLGEAGEDRREGLPRGGDQEGHLSSFMSFCLFCFATDAHLASSWVS